MAAPPLDRVLRHEVAVLRRTGEAEDLSEVHAVDTRIVELQQHRPHAGVVAAAGKRGAQLLGLEGSRPTSW
jgi:hypothetical protein